jgi:hypothetical protein
MAFRWGRSVGHHLVSQLFIACVQKSANGIQLLRKFEMRAIWVEETFSKSVFFNKQLADKMFRTTGLK